MSAPRWAGSSWRVSPDGPREPGLSHGSTESRQGAGEQEPFSYLHSEIPITTQGLVNPIQRAGVIVYVTSYISVTNVNQFTICEGGRILGTIHFPDPFG